MGIIIRLTCEECEKKPILEERYVVCFSLGIGMLYSKKRLLGDDELSEPPMLRTMINEKKIKNTINEILNEKCYLDSDYGHELFYCYKCNKLIEKFAFRIIYKDNAFSPEYYCSRCKNKMENVSVIAEKGSTFIVNNNNERIQYYCPVCGSKKVRLEEIGVWE